MTGDRQKKVKNILCNVTESACLWPDHVSDWHIELSLLGLGGIVIPGFFLSLLLRFDASRANIATTNVNIRDNFPKPYFHSALITYVLGLCMTLFVMTQFTRHSQLSCILCQHAWDHPFCVL